MELSELCDTATLYAERKLAILPLHSVVKDRCSCGTPNCSSPAKHPRTMHGVKDATTDQQQVKSWWEMWGNANIGIATGKISGIVVLDVDGQEGLDTLNGRHLPPTWCAETGKGLHYYFQYPNFPVKNAVRIENGLDIRSDGGFVVAPPSLHISGKRYKWAEGLSPSAVELAPLPQWLVERLRVTSAKTTATQLEVPDVIVHGARNDTLFKMGCLLRAKGLSETEILAALQAANRERCSPPLEDAEVADIAASAGKYEAGKIKTQGFPLTDYGNAERLITIFGDNLRYVPAWNAWLIWDGVRWAKDDTLQIERFAKETVRGMYSAAANIQDHHERAALAKWATQSEAAWKRAAMIESARSEEGVVILPSTLDTNPYLLGCENGVIDLHTGEILEPQRSNYITKQIPVHYDPNADCPRFELFLSQILPDPEIRQYFLKVMGLSLTGDMSEQCFFFLYGSGANGKSTLCDVWGTLLGDYYHKAQAETFMARVTRDIPNDIAALCGARLVIPSEISKGQKLNESLIKDITGGDLVSARFLHQEYFTFKPGCKLVFYGNHKPIVRGKDVGIWRRVRLIPFNVQVPEEEQDRRLPEKLLTELPGILNLAIKNCLLWQQEGLQSPNAIVEATKEYQAEEDRLREFISACCWFGKDAKVIKKKLWDVQLDWCEFTGEPPYESKRQFFKDIEEYPGVKSGSGHGNVAIFRGIGLKSEQIEEMNNCYMGDDE